MKDYNELNQKANDMRCETEDEIVSFMLKKKDNIYSNEVMKVTGKEFNTQKVVDRALSVALVLLTIYTIVMTVYIFFNGYPY